MSQKELSVESFLAILKNDAFSYNVISKQTELIGLDFPNLPEWHQIEDDEEYFDFLPESTITCFEFKGLNYKLRYNIGSIDTYDATFGALYDENNEIIVNLESVADAQTKITSLKDEDNTVDDELRNEMKMYLKVFFTILEKGTELEHLIIKILWDNGDLWNLEEFQRECDYFNKNPDNDSE